MTKPLDAAWRHWLRENLDRHCDPRELLAILLRHGFALSSIRECMGGHFPGTPQALGKPVPPAWQAWVKQNLERQCDPRELFVTLLNNGFELKSILDLLGDRLARPSVAPSVGAQQADYAAIASPPMLRKPTPGLAKIPTDRLQLYVLDNFLGSAECEALAALINERLRPSTVTFGDDREFRTSRTCDLSLLGNPIVDAVDEKIARTLGIRRSYAEINQGQRYDPRQQFKSHTDYFEPGTDEYREHCSLRGNRTWTFMVYLNEGMEGGGTHFPAIDTIFQPRKGQAVIWNNLNSDGTPNANTLHCGMPVLSGHKVIVTQWFRERGSGPMFYDDPACA